MSQNGEAIEELLAIMDRLLGEDGCPWDREQTHASLVRYLIEETYEVIDTINQGNMDELANELGDLLLQIVFHAALAKFQEEVEELVQAENQKDKFEETGDLFFALVNLARMEGIEPEQALQASNDKFARRFHYIEQTLETRGRKFEEMSLADLDLIWDEAKAKGW